MKTLYKLKSIKIKQIPSFVFLLFLSFFYPHCPDDKKHPDYEKEFETRVILFYLLLNPADPQAACMSGMKSEETCLASAGGKPITPINEMNLSLVLSKNQYTTYSAYCQNLLSSSAFTNYSDRSKQCVMNCSKTYWDQRINQNLCTADFTTQLTDLQTGTKTCVTDCFSLTSNTLNL